MPQFKVTVQRDLYVSGEITVEAKDADAAIRKVDRMIRATENPLEIEDARIEWGEPVYEDDTFTTTGDVD